MTSGSPIAQVAAVVANVLDHDLHIVGHAKVLLNARSATAQGAAALRAAAFRNSGSGVNYQYVKTQIVAFDSTASTSNAAT